MATTLMVDYIISLDGYGAGEGWPGFWGLEGDPVGLPHAEERDRHQVRLAGVGVRGDHALVRRQIVGVVHHEHRGGPGLLAVDLLRDAGAVAAVDDRELVAPLDDTGGGERLRRAPEGVLARQAHHLELAETVEVRAVGVDGFHRRAPPR